MYDRLRQLDDTVFGAVVWTRWGPRRRTRPMVLLIIYVLIFGGLSAGVTAADGPMGLIFLAGPPFGAVCGRFVRGYWPWQMPPAEQTPSD